MAAPGSRATMAVEALQRAVTVMRRSAVGHGCEHADLERVSTSLCCSGAVRAAIDQYGARRLNVSPTEPDGRPGTERRVA
jgi:hypothetical protein